jgi:7,8-dihydropterin-6-yl-methyl-4-(beta-D-ribofuranosyl)aminobenzene 5'-phosphate synthase
MCLSEDAAPTQVAAATPRDAPGEAADPIRLAPVDSVSVTTLVDNVYDGLLGDDEMVRRASLAGPSEPAAQFLDGAALVGMRAEHGYSTLVTVTRGEQSWQLVFDTGLSPDAMIENARRLELDLRGIRAVVMSHGHFDHAGGLLGLAQAYGRRGLPLTIHPFAWARRRFAVPGSDGWELPTLSKSALAAEGFDLVERTVPSLLLDGSVLVTGEVDRVTDFELGMAPAHQAWDDAAWLPDRAVRDDQALVVHVRDRGLVVVTGCGHAGVVNIVRHAMRLTGVPHLAALVGGFHLGGPAFEPIIAPTVTALRELTPQLLVPGHCTGWRAQHALAAALPGSFRPGSSGSTYTIAA